MRQILLVASATAFAAMPALADVPGKGWISRDKAVTVISQRGAKVTKIEADDGHWEGEATKAGVRYEFHVDPMSGRVTKWERDTD